MAPSLLHPPPLLLCFAVLAGTAALCDLKWRRIPNPWSVSIALTGLLAQGACHGGWAALGALAALLSVALLLGVAWSRGHLGGADLKLAAAAATWVGLARLPQYLLTVALAGGLVSLLAYRVSKPEARLQMRANLLQASLGGELAAVGPGTGGRVSVPYGAAIAAGALITLLFDGEDPMGRLSLAPRAEAGASAVEFALVLPLLMLLVLGSLDWGHYFYLEQVVVNASREGARVGSLQAPSDAVAEADARAAAAAYLDKGGLDAAKATVTVQVLADAVAVTVEYPAGSLTGFADVVLPSRAHATSEMRR